MSETHILQERKDSKSFELPNQESLTNPLLIGLQNSKLFKLTCLNTQNFTNSNKINSSQDVGGVNQDSKDSKITNQQIKEQSTLYDTSGKSKLQREKDFQNMETSTQLPSTLLDWFSSLSSQDKHLGCSLVDSEIVEEIVCMILHCRNHGESLFKLEQNSNIMPYQQLEKQTQEYIKESNPEIQLYHSSPKIQDSIGFKFISKSKKCMVQMNEEIATQQLQIAKTNIQEKQQTLVPTEINTLTVSSSLFKQEDLLINIANEIVGDKFLKSTIKFNFDEANNLKQSSLPEWLDIQEYHSPAKWILALIEITIQLQYQIWLKHSKGNLDISSQLIINHQNQLIDQKHVLCDILSTLKQKYESDQKYLIELINQCESAEIQELSMIIALFMNQESEQFSIDLRLSSTYKLSTSEFESERAFINLLLSNYQSKNSESHKKAIKNQKKKNKRKQKKAQQLQTVQLLTDEDQIIKNGEEEKASPIMQSSKISTERFFDLKQLINEPLKEEFPFNQRRKESHKETRCGDIFDNQDTLSDSNIFQLFEFEYKENDDTQINERMDKISSFSDSTVDILGNFSSENFKNRLKSPQHSSNTQIELDMLKNIYSSDAGDSSIQLQKQFSDYCLAKDSSNTNIEFQYQTKNKESIDNLQIDVSITNDNNTSQIQKLEDQLRQNSASNIPLQSKIFPKQSQQEFNQQQIDDSSNKFQIIRSAQSYQNEQQSLRQNQRKKKNKNVKKGGKGGNSHLNFAAQEKQMNNFMRNMLQHNNNNDQIDEDCEDYDDQDETSNVQPSDLIQNQPIINQTNTNQSQKSQESFKETQSPSKRPVYIKKQAQSGQLPSNNTIKQSHIEQSKIIESSTSNNASGKNNSQQPQNLKKNQINQDSNIDFYSSFQTSDQSKKKKNFKSKGKSGNSQWERGGNKKKSGKSKGGMQSQSQLLKQNSYEMNSGNSSGTYGSYGMNQQNNSYANQFFNNNGFFTDMEEFKKIIKQNLIQDQIQKSIQASQQLSSQTDFSQQNQVIIEDNYELGEDLDCDPDQKLTEIFFEHLEIQMRNYQKQIERKLESVRKERETAIQIIRSIVASLYKDERNSVAVKLYGSMASNLSIDTSDVDLAVVGLDFQGNKERQINEMRNLIDQINLIMKKSTKLKFIETALVPVIKLEVDLVQIAKNQERSEKNELGSHLKQNQIDESMRYLGIDITFEDTIKQHYYGVHVDNLSRINLGIQCINYIKGLCKDIPGLQTIVLILKKLLQVNDLNQTFKGGLNSYSIVLMTSAYLKKFPSVQSISKNIMEFFHFYGEYFDPKSTIISSHASPHFIQQNIISNDNMIICDPLDINNNPAKGAYKISIIKELFKEYYFVLQECLNQFKQNQKEINVIQVLLSHQKQHSYLFSNFSPNNKFNQL